MPSRLRPKASLATDAILVGDPGRALLLAQELLDQPKMSNHARGLWGYSGETPAGGKLTIQATGMGGPSAAAILADLAKLGVRRAVRIGTCAGLGPEASLGAMLLVTEAVAAGGSATSLGISPGEVVEPDPALTKLLKAALKEQARPARIASFDAMPPHPDQTDAEELAADMQTVAVLARGRQLGITSAAILIVAENAIGKRLADQPLEEAAKRAGQAVSSALGTTKPLS